MWQWTFKWSAPPKRWIRMMAPLRAVMCVKPADPNAAAIAYRCPVYDAINNWQK